jgi:hypothetical protein
MDADYSIELGPAAPALELPWLDPDGQMQYVELRGGTETIAACVDRIPEARKFPALRRFLVTVNCERSAWLTAKCDAWTDEAEAAENMYNASFELSSYVDIVLADSFAELRGDLEFHRGAAMAVARMLEENKELEATAEIMVRRCYFHRNGNMEESDAGYCMTMFLTGYGARPEAAARSWEEAMDFAARCWIRFHPHERRAPASELG